MLSYRRIVVVRSWMETFISQLAIIRVLSRQMDTVLLMKHLAVHHLMHKSHRQTRTICVARSFAFIWNRMALIPFPKEIFLLKENQTHRPEIYVMGCRNPYRISIDEKTGYLYWGEVGPDAGQNDSLRGPRGYDEVNQAKKAGYFGWPYFVGKNYPYAKYDFQKRKGSCKVGSQCSYK